MEKEIRKGIWHLRLLFKRSAVLVLSLGIMKSAFAFQPLDFIQLPMSICIDALQFTKNLAYPAVLIPEKLEPSRVAPAVRMVLEEYTKHHMPNPLAKEVNTNPVWKAQEEKEFARWKSELYHLPKLLDLGTQPTEFKDNGLYEGYGVQEVRIDGRTYFFRRVDEDGNQSIYADIRAARARTLVNVYRLQEKFFPKRNHIPYARPAILNGHRGILIDGISGKFDKIDLNKDVDADSLAFATAFQFLIANADLNRNKNLCVHERKLYNYDPDFALINTIVEINDSGSWLGTSLPDHYPPDFVEGLKNLVQNLERDMGNSLDPRERFYLLLRAQVIFADMKLRPESLKPAPHQP